MASSLADEACEACTSEDEPLTEAEYAEYLTEIDDDVWEVVNDHHLEAEYPFEDFRDALEFTYEIGELAEEEWHHPEIRIHYKKVEVRFTDHEAGGISNQDMRLAELVNSEF